MSNLIYPNINPVLLSLGPIQIHWYGLMYLIGFMSAWLLALYRARGSKIWSSIMISDVIFYCATGVLIGGRVGYMFLYDFSDFIKNPLDIFKIWQGGMAFHGGLLGVLVAIIFFCRKNKINFFTVSDFIVPLVPIGLGAGRIGNFINGELWGRVTQMPWGLIYPQAGPLPRHPSEIYEFLLEGLILFIILWWFSGKRPPRMATSGMFLLIYGVFRIFCELFRQPDEQIGFVLFGWMTKGQLLSIPMVIAGLFLLYLAYFYKQNVIYRIIDCELIQGKIGV